jgi:hypothetical protein
LTFLSNLFVFFQKLLQDPVVACALGKLYNKDAIIEYLLNKNAYGDGDIICSHISNMKVFKEIFIALFLI